MIDSPIWIPHGARRIFEETCARLETDNRPPERFAMTIAQYAQAVDEWERACMDISTQGTVIVRGDRHVKNPRLEVRDQAHMKMSKLADELGLTPGSAIAKDDPWDPDLWCDTLEDVIADMEAEALELEAAQTDGTA